VSKPDPRTAAAPAEPAPAEPAPAEATFGCEPPQASTVLPLVVYYQIVQKADRPDASRIGFAMPEGFPSAGIEYVATAEPSRQAPRVRYYYPDQQNAAEFLACMLNGAYTSITGHKPRFGDAEAGFKAQPLGSRFKNLPPYRIEVWFPPITPPA
jgi:hypothetical protein